MNRILYVLTTLPDDRLRYLRALASPTLCTQMAGTRDDLNAIPSHDRRDTIHSNFFAVPKPDRGTHSQDGIHADVITAFFAF